MAEGEVAMSEGDMRWAFRSGDHMCWLVGSRAEYDAGERELLARAAHAGDSVMIVGERLRTKHHAPGAAGELDVRVGRGGSAVLEVMREQAHSVGRAGLGLRILAQMEHLAPSDAGLDDLIAREMDVAELAGHGATSVVCAYQHSAWKRELLSGVAAVHSRVVGPAPGTAGFRILRAGTDVWTVHGEIGYEAAASFAAALRALLARYVRVRLDCTKLELIDAAGWRALVEAATSAPGARVLLERVNDTVAAAWRLSGYDDGTIPVQVRS
jgi:anti-anti-sigma regulatory factor